MARWPLTLERFLPYRLSVITNRISGALSRHYAARFGISIPEWRVIANLGRYPGLSANQVAERSAMDKVTVSRAVARSEEHTSELQSLMRISYAVFCLKKKNK